jgi:hypothetical protein
MRLGEVVRLVCMIVSRASAVVYESSLLDLEFDSRCIFSRPVVLVWFMRKMLAVKKPSARNRHSSAIHGF